MSTELATQPVGKLLIKYSIPAIIAMMVNGLYNVVDRIFIGNIPGVGELAIAGLGITLPLMTILLAFGLLIGIGAAANISLRLGEGKGDLAEKILGNAGVMGIMIGIPITIIGLLFSNQILLAFGASEASLPYAKEYMDIITIGTVPYIIAISVSHLIRSDGNPKLSAIIMAGGCALNIILDAIFIFGLEMGIRGAALATIIAQMGTVFWGLLYFIKGNSNLKFHISNMKPDFTIIKIILAIGVAPFTLQLATSCVQIIANNALRAFGGDSAIAAFATINSIMIMVTMPVIGVNQGAQPIIGFNYGAKQYNRSTQAFKICIIAITIMLSIGWLLIQSFPNILVRPFSGNNPDLVALTSNGLRKYSTVLPVIGITIFGSTYMQAIGKAKYAMLLSLLRQVILLIPLMLTLPYIFGLNGVWFSQPIADSIAALVSAIIVIREIRSIPSATINEADMEAPDKITELVDPV